MTLASNNITSLDGAMTLWFHVVAQLRAASVCVGPETMISKMISSLPRFCALLLLLSETAVLGQPLQAVPAAPRKLSQIFVSADGKYHITIDASGASDLADWAFKELAPVTQEWYPKIAQLLPSKGFQPPDRVAIDFGNDNAGFVAITHGNHITCTTPWFRENLRGEARGCVVHELVHVVQQYNYGDDPAGPTASPPPGWLAEGIPDYIRWFLYEPQAHGADVSWMRQQHILDPHYDGSYRISANFLNWATQKYNTNLVPELNVVLREGHYREDIWRRLAGHRVDELGTEWQKWLTAEMRTQPKD